MLRLLALFGPANYSASARSPWMATSRSSEALRSPLQRGFVGLPVDPHSVESAVSQRGCDGGQIDLGSDNHRNRKPALARSLGPSRGRLGWARWRRHSSRPRPRSVRQGAGNARPAAGHDQRGSAMIQPVAVKTTELPDATRISQRLRSVVSVPCRCRSPRRSATERPGTATRRLPGDRDRLWSRPRSLDLVCCLAIIGSP
jgi:hypothetical protein